MQILPIPLSCCRSPACPHATPEGPLPPPSNNSGRSMGCSGRQGKPEISVLAMEVSSVSRKSWLDQCSIAIIRTIIIPVISITCWEGSATCLPFFLQDMLTSYMSVLRERDWPTGTTCCPWLGKFCSIYIQSWVDRIYLEASSTETNSLVCLKFKSRTSLFYMVTGQLNIAEQVDTRFCKTKSAEAMLYLLRSVHTPNGHPFLLRAERIFCFPYVVLLNSFQIHLWKRYFISVLYKHSS